MEHLNEIIKTAISTEKLISHQREENKKRTEQITNEKNLEISILKQKIEILKRGISSSAKNLAVPVRSHILFSKDVDFQIAASMYFYNPSEGSGDPHWRSVDRTEDFNETRSITIKNATIYFVNAYYELSPEESAEKLHERTNLAIAFDFDYVRASGTIWMYYHGASKSVLDPKAEFEAKSFKENEKIGGLSFDSEKLIRFDHDILEHMNHIYGQLYLPASKHGMHYTVLDRVKETHKSRVSEAVA